tara:strand:+ start:3452 stop:3715 length:264 start_codon:yes stop_codon:yes gene_type:complete
MTKKEKIIKLLQEGYSVLEITKKLNIKDFSIYTLAKKHKLPRNSKIKSGGVKEKRIQRLYNSGFTFEEIGEIYSQTPSNIKKILKIE